MPDYDYLESVLPAFTDARDIIKAAGDTVVPLGQARPISSLSSALTLFS
jgi:hypothetical protein